MLNGLANIVRTVGEELLALRSTSATEGQWQGNQLKIEADRQAHDRTVGLLSELNPVIPVVSEEDPNSHGPDRPDRYFLIDPIDGTASFADGFPGYVTQIALMEEERPVMAAIYAPSFDQLYLAERGCGATLNVVRLTVGPRSGSNVLIDNYPEPRGTAREAFDALGMTGYVECGGISLKICRVADGTADVFFKDVTVRDWDVAAPDLVITEAGGTLAGLDGAPFGYNGRYEKPGLIVTRTTASANAVSDWLAARPTVDSGPSVAAQE